MLGSGGGGGGGGGGGVNTAGADGSSEGSAAPSLTQLNLPVRLERQSSCCCRLGLS